MTTTIWWIRRDLRLTDNQALHRAAQRGDQVIPLFVLDPALLNSAMVGEGRTAFLFGGLRALDADLQERGSRLILRAGEPAQVLADLVAETGAEAIFAEADVSPYARRRDEAVADGLPLTLTEGRTILPVDAVRKKDGDPYTVFTPYSRTWRGLDLPERGQILAAPKQLVTPMDVAGDPLPAQPSLPAQAAFPPGEAEGKRRLGAFLAGADAPIFRYDLERDRMDLDATSRLSPYLRFGMISPRLAAVGALEAIAKAPNSQGRENAQVWLTELIWREFYASILWHHPHVSRGSFRPEYDAIAWANNEVEFAAWCQGRTGYPVVDAAMRQLNRTGWMHNRARMIVASFLVKDLLIDWRWGERYFMQRLLDGDPAANNGGWQWAAGTGTDAAPYFRIFNPTAQGQKFDPDGAYIRRWVPELANVPDKFLHEPWNLSKPDQIRARCVLGQDYPHPTVDHAWARQRVLDAYKAVKDT